MEKYVEINAFTDRVLQTMKYKHDKQLLINHCVSYPRADVVEVVRCKDCMWRRKWKGEKSYYCGKDNVAFLGDLKPNFYCGYGKRRKDNGNS